MNGLTTAPVTGANTGIGDDTAAVHTPAEHGLDGEVPEGSSSDRARMRLLFVAAPLHGHVLPMAPLMEAAVDDGHDVALEVWSGMADVIATELPDGVEHLPVGLAPSQLAEAAARRSGSDLVEPSPAFAGEFFAGVPLDTVLDDVLAAARQWRPDTVVTEAYDSVGRFLAVALGVPYHVVELVAGPRPDFARAVGRFAAGRYAARGLAPVPPAGVLDPRPPMLADTGPRTDGAPVHPMRPRPHRRPAGRSATAVPPTFADPSRPTVLVSLGTIMSDPVVLAAAVDGVLAAGANVVATVGYSLGSTDPAPAAPQRAGEIHSVGFEPVDQLLDGVTVVVSSGGSGMALAALCRGIPLVLWPQGTDQPHNAVRLRAAGLAVTVSDAASLGSAVRTVLTDPRYARRAGQAADEIAAMPSAADVLHRVVVAPRR